MPNLILPIQHNYLQKETHLPLQTVSEIVFIKIGQEFEIGTLRVRVPVSGAKSIQIKPITGLMNRVSVSTVIRNATNPTVNVLTTNIANTDWHYMDAAVDLTTTGDI